MLLLPKAALSPPLAVLAEPKAELPHPQGRRRPRRPAWASVRLLSKSGSEWLPRKRRLRILQTSDPAPGWQAKFCVASVAPLVRGPAARTGWGPCVPNAQYPRPRRTIQRGLGCRWWHKATQTDARFLGLWRQSIPADRRASVDTKGGGRCAPRHGHRISLLCGSDSPALKLGDTLLLLPHQCFQFGQPTA